MSQLLYKSQQHLKYCCQDGSCHTSRNNLERSVYIGVSIHSEALKKELVDTLLEFGQYCVSYVSVVSIYTGLGDSIF